MHGSHVTTQEHRPNSASTLHSALSAEGALPNNCWTYSVASGLSADIDIETGHPLCGGRPALFVGSFFILRDNSRHGCLYRPNGATSAYVRRMALKRVPREEKADLLFLVRPDEGTQSHMLFVNSRLPSGVKPKHKFYFGAHSSEDEKCLIKAGNGEALFELMEGQSVTVFHPTGEVVRIICTNNRLETVTLTVEEQIEARVLWAENLFASSTDRKVRDRAHFELVSAIAVNRNPSNRRSAFEALLKNIEENGPLPGIVFDEVKGVLFEHGDEMSMARLKKAQCSADSVSSCANERAKKEAERRARQLETSQLGHQKGPGGGKPDLRSNPKKAEKRARKAAAKK